MSKKDLLQVIEDMFITFDEDGLEPTGPCGMTGSEINQFWRLKVTHAVNEAFPEPVITLYLDDTLKRVIDKIQHLTRYGGYGMNDEDSIELQNFINDMYKEIKFLREAKK
jgi:hypothetical protein